MSLSVAKSMLAKLLSMENLTVTQSAGARTASFDLKNRVLTLPLLKSMEDDESVHYEGFIIHEIAHALFSDTERYMALASKYGASKTNIMEDVRINRLVVDMYPGAKRVYINHYGKLFADGFYGVDDNTVNSRGFFDKVNIHYKVGAMAGVEFKGEELKFVPMLDKLRTMDDLEELLEALANQKSAEPETSEDEVSSSSSEEEQSESSEPESGEESESGDSEESESTSSEEESGECDEPESESGDSEESEEESDSDEGAAEGDEPEGGDSEESEEESDSEGGDSEESEEESEGDSEDETPQGSSGESDFESDPETQDDFDENFADNFFESDASRIKVRHVGEIEDYEDYIVDYKEVLSTYEASLLYLQNRLVENEERGFATAGERNTLNSRLGEQYNSFEASIKSDVAYLVKTFESKKSAQEFQKTKIRKSGTLDMRLINKYMMTDNLFKSNETKPEGKNHGIVMMLDFSGSMSGDNLSETVKQVLILTAFAKRIGIPFDVYAFGNSSGMRAKSVTFKGLDGVPTAQIHTNDFCLYHILSSKMKTSEYRRMRQLLYTGSNNDHGRPISIFRLYNSTPLNPCLLLLSQVVSKFKTDNAVEICSIMVLTDGDGNSSEHFGSFQDRIVDSVTNKEYEVGRHTYYGAPDGLLYEILKDRTESNLIAFFIGRTSNVKRSCQRKMGAIDWNEHKRAINAAFKNKGMVTIPYRGVDAYIFMRSDKSSSESEIEKATAAAFKRAMVNKKTSRVFADKLLGIVA